MKVRFEYTSDSSEEGYRLITSIKSSYSSCEVLNSAQNEECCPLKTKKEKHLLKSNPKHQHAKNAFDGRNATCSLRKDEEFS